MPCFEASSLYWLGCRERRVAGRYRRLTGAGLRNTWPWDAGRQRCMGAAARPAASGFNLADADPRKKSPSPDTARANATMGRTKAAPKPQRAGGSQGHGHGAAFQVFKCRFGLSVIARMVAVAALPVREAYHHWHDPDHCRRERNRLNVC